MAMQWLWQWQNGSDGSVGMEVASCDVMEAVRCDVIEGGLMIAARWKRWMCAGGGATAVAGWKRWMREGGGATAVAGWKRWLHDGGGATARSDGDGSGLMATAG